jgi:hypothetical protein
MALASTLSSLPRVVLLAQPTSTLHPSPWAALALSAQPSAARVSLIAAQLQKTTLRATMIPHSRATSTQLTSTDVYHTKDNKWKRDVCMDSYDTQWAAAARLFVVWASRLKDKV